MASKPRRPLQRVLQQLWHTQAIATCPHKPCGGVGRGLSGTQPSHGPNWVGRPGAGGMGAANSAQPWGWQTTLAWRPCMAEAHVRWRPWLTKACVLWHAQAAMAGRHVPVLWWPWLGRVGPHGACKFRAVCGADKHHGQTRGRPGPHVGNCKTGRLGPNTWRRCI